MANLREKNCWAEKSIQKWSKVGESRYKVGRISVGPFILDPPTYSSVVYCRFGEGDIIIIVSFREKKKTTESVLFLSVGCVFVWFFFGPVVPSLIFGRLLVWLLVCVYVQNIPGTLWVLLISC